MGSRLRRKIFYFAIALFFLAPLNCPGVVFFSTGDPAFNTTAPEGALRNSGWELQGEWSFFLGTPIGSNYFMTAKHVGGSKGDTFLLGGEAFFATAEFKHPTADLAIWRVGNVFTNFAQVFTGSNEVGRPLIVFGRGRQRGAEIRLNGELRGWEWGTPDGRLRWGENTVAGITDDRGNPLTGPDQREYLRAVFRTNAGPNEAHLSNGDSGGGVFMEENGTWKLAGINSSVDGGYNTNSAGKGFDATLFDERGFYEGSEREWEYRYGLHIQPGGFFATRVSAYRNWVDRILTYGNPKGEMSVEHAPTPEGPFETVTGAEINGETLSARVPAPGASRFYRLRALEPVRIVSITNSNQGLVITFE